MSSSGRSKLKSETSMADGRMKVVQSNPREGASMTETDRGHVLPSKHPSALVVAPTEPHGNSAEAVPEEKPIIVVRNLAVTVLACLAVVFVLQYAQPVLVPIVI